jgi:threonine/homoserine/homoserine lactone efflux protein
MAAASPGANLLIVTRTSAGRSLGAGILTALGVATTSTVWCWLQVSAETVVVVNSTWWHCALNLLFSTEGEQRVYRRAKLWIDVLRAASWRRSGRV